MASLKRLNGVAHDIAHHSQSGLSWLHPHLAQLCRLSGVSSASIDLLADNPYPVGVAHAAPLAKALGALREWFESNLIAQGFATSDVRRVRLAFLFRQGGDDYTCAVIATVEDRDGRAHSADLPFIG
jgi:hypothetical protein